MESDRTSAATSGVRDGAVFCDALPSSTLRPREWQRLEEAGAERRISTVKNY